MDRKLNIAIFASAYHPSLGGVEELCSQLALELIHQGHHVIVLTNRWPRDLPARETIDGIPVYRLPFRLPEGSAKAAINYHLSNYLITQRMLLILHENKIDMLHVQCVSSNAHYALIAQDRLKLPLVVTLQGELTMDANQIFQKSPQAQNILRRAMDKAQVVTACSAKTLRDGEEFYGKALGEKTRVVFNGVNLRAFAPPTNDDQRTTNNGLATEGTEITEEKRSEALQCPSSSYLLTPNSSRSGPPRRYIFALGRMAREKGFDILLLAYAALRPTAEHPAPGTSHLEQNRSAALQSDSKCQMLDAKCSQEPPLPSMVIAGAGPELEPLKRLVAELGLTDRVLFPGRADRQQVAAYMLGCEFFVLSSRADEGLPVVCAEAMGAGCAIVATRSGGAPEAVLDGQTGLLVDKENVDQLATAMQQLIDNPDLRHRLATAGKARAAQFAWPVIAKQYEAIYAAAAAAAQ